MNKKDIAAFFDRLAPTWDEDTIRSDAIIGKILDGAAIGPGAHVLDVACGTGVLMPDYLSRQVRVTGIDIAPGMIEVAKGKFPQGEWICDDVEQHEFSTLFDNIMVYNAFPHFPDPEGLIRTLSGLLKPGGTLTVAHGMSRREIDHRHHGPAAKVSLGLMHEDDLAAIFAKYLTVTVKISDDRMYQVTGKR